MLLKRCRIFRILCVANIVNVIVLLVSRPFVRLLVFQMQRNLGGNSEFLTIS